MRKNVGKRIMEIADIYYKYFVLTTTITGVLEIIAGVVIAIAAESFWIFLVGAVVGALTIWAGAWVAEVSTIKMYGHGIIVDRMEHLNPEYFDDCIVKQPCSSDAKKTTASVKNTTVPVKSFFKPNNDSKPITNTNPEIEQSKDAISTLIAENNQKNGIPTVKYGKSDKPLIERLGKALEFRGPIAVRRYVASMVVETKEEEIIWETIMRSEDSDIRSVIERFL